ncbi:MAG TPA: SDR family oxidoreductase [Acidimicrobiales bacterium]|jgi:NAD(P)-dependent dehydrogenase (short-subunit alcohol dehydrogenase family)|nr:SDR family oxidoreductase [Acidimicrobiales bacterium]
MSSPDRPVVVVTGASSGLGEAVAWAAHRAGWQPAALDVRPPAGPWPYQQVDLASAKDAEQALRRVGDDLGRIDAVVTSAGIDVPGHLAELDTDTWERVVAVNLLGTAAVIRAALPWLIPARGKVVTVSSTLGHRAVGGATAYCASKFGVVGFTRALTAELQGRVGVTLLTPGGMETHFFDRREAQYRPGPDADLADPQRVAAAVVVALEQAPGCEIRELVVTSPQESSWP